MRDPRLRQGQACGQSLEPVPAHTPVSLAPPLEAVEPDAPDFPQEPIERVPVVRQAEVAVVAPQHAGVPAVLFGQRRVHLPPRLLAQRCQLARQALALRLVLDDEPAVPGPPAVVGEAEKGEVSGRRSPRCRRAMAGRRPNSIRRVLSSCSSRPNLASRSLRSASICLVLAQRLENSATSTISGLRSREQLQANEPFLLGGSS
jgi:hypothetical protein